MFSFGTGNASLAAGRHDPDKERKPPALPTPLSFPSPDLPSKVGARWNTNDAPDLVASFAALRKPADVTVEHLRLLNVDFQHADNAALLVPYHETYIPPDDWLEPLFSDETDNGTASAPGQSLLRHGRPIPARKDFFLRLRELQFDNYDAFSALTRLQKLDRKPPRLVQSRKFWEGLDNMAYYWDTSLDQYIPPVGRSPPQSPRSPRSATSSPDGERVLQFRRRNDQSRKKAKMGASPAPSSPGSIHPAFDHFVVPHSPPSATTVVGRQSSVDHASPVSPKSPTKAKAGPASASHARRRSMVARPPTPPGTYKGNRIGTGRDMPEQYRVDTVKAFMETICWAFGITLAPHRRATTVTIRNLRCPVRVTAAAWITPPDRMKARQGWLEGPVLGMQCRPEVDFSSTPENASASLVDTARELGGLLCLAQERAREGRVEVRPGEGKWWTSTPRWGGGAGGEMGEADASKTGETAEPADGYRPPVSSRGRHRSKKSPAELWKELQPNQGYWDPRVKYEAIGKGKGSEWDDVYMVSSINHHVKIMRLHVHAAYLHYMETGEVPSQPRDSNWSTPVVTQTRWFDLFNKDDRTEAAVQLWAIVGYLLRPDTSDGNGDKDVEMSEAP